MHSRTVYDTKEALTASWKVYSTERVINGESCALWQGK
jgi:hypothetical protein